MNDEETRIDDGLTANEVQVLKLLAEGKGMAEIADSMDLTEERARNHRKHIMKHLNLYNLTDLTQYAADKGLVSSEGRSSKRLDVELNGTALFTIFGRPVESQIRVRDLSAHGVYVLSGAAPEVGDTVEISLHQETPKLVFEAEGAVTRVDQLAEDERGIAIHFQNIPDLDH
ncbi:MAG: LuxR C-terminal-related transcriptional regulator [Acidobacteriota bacterium]